MRAIAVGVFALSMSASTVFAQEQNTLPLERVRLYETGVGYYERSGQLGVGKDVALPVPAGHLDDALKTLVVMSKDGKTTVSGAHLPNALGLRGQQFSGMILSACAGMFAASEF